MIEIENKYTSTLLVYIHTTRSRLKVDYKLTKEVKSQLLRNRMSIYI